MAYTESVNSGITIEEIAKNLEQARADVAFWEKAMEVLTDPRISNTSRPQSLETSKKIEARSRQLFSMPTKGTYGTLKGTVYDSLPAAGNPPVTVSQIIENMKSNGYMFAAKIPGIAVNEALRSLAKDHKAYVAAKAGMVQLWARVAETKDSDWLEELAKNEKEVTEATS